MIGSRPPAGPAAAGRDRSLEAVRPQSADGNSSARAAGRFFGEHDDRRLAALRSSRLRPDVRRVLDQLVSTSGEPQSVALAIGPEGGFSDAEVELAASSGWLPVGLGRHLANRNGRAWLWRRSSQFGSKEPDARSLIGGGCFSAGLRLRRPSRLCRTSGRRGRRRPGAGVLAAKDQDAGGEHAHAGEWESVRLIIGVSPAHLTGKAILNLTSLSPYCIRVSNDQSPFSSLTTLPSV